jgi:hypothetical protein
VGARDKELCTRTEGGIKLEEARVWKEMDAVRRIEEESGRLGRDMELMRRLEEQKRAAEWGERATREKERLEEERRKEEEIANVRKRRRNLRKASEISTTDADWRSACITLKGCSSPIYNRPQLDTL